MLSFAFLVAAYIESWVSVWSVSLNGICVFAP